MCLTFVVWQPVNTTFRVRGVKLMASNRKLRVCRKIQFVHKVLQSPLQIMNVKRTVRTFSVKMICCSLIST